MFTSPALLQGSWPYNFIAAMTTVRPVFSTSSLRQPNGGHELLIRYLAIRDGACVERDHSKPIRETIFLIGIQHRVQYLLFATQ